MYVSFRLWVCANERRAEKSWMGVLIMFVSMQF